MSRNVFRCWLAALLLGPACAFALEVGEIQVDSALNQLFDARIPLPTLSPEELGRISVKVASPTMFKEFGLDRGATLDHLVFSIQYDAEGKVYVKVVSIKPIHEPSLALLLEFGWPRGKTFREFTVLLDPVRRLVEQPAAGRTKTVLDTPADTEADSGSKSPSADIVVNRTIQYPDQPTSSPEASSWVYRPGDVYGPVKSGEGLWGIALKIRPDPGITREQMMQALFQANPDAFSKVGVDGLRIGALLRIPTFQEIADFTDSAVARQLAVTEKTMMEKAATDDAGTGIASAGEAPASAVEQVVAGTSASNLAVFPLTQPSVPEPIPPAPEPKPDVSTAEPAAVAASEPKPEVPEPAAVAASEPKPEVPEPAAVAASEPKPDVSTAKPAAVAASEPKPEVPEPAVAAVSEPKPEVSTAEPAAVAVSEPKPEVSTAEPAAVAASEPKPDVSTAEPAAVAVSEPKLEVVEPDPALNTVASGLATPTVVAPVSATPLLFLVVSEVMASATAQIPLMPIAPQNLSDARIADARASAPALAFDADAVMSSELDDQTTTEPSTTSQATNDASATVAADVFKLSPTADAAESLVAESIVRPVAGFAVLPVLESAEAVPAADSTKPPVVESAAPSGVETVEITGVAEVAESPKAETAEMTKVAEVAEAADSTAIEPEKSAMSVYKGGEQYGPVVPNERLWDIAAKVRPVPDIGIDIMMKALFAINPTAFSKAGMDYLKVGATLRVPTLREIVDHTGSKVAKQLLEQQAAANEMAEPESSTRVPPSSPPAAASGSGTGSEPEPEPRSIPSSPAAD